MMVGGAEWTSRLKIETGRNGAGVPEGSELYCTEFTPKSDVAWWYEWKLIAIAHSPWNGRSSRRGGRVLLNEKCTKRNVRRRCPHRRTFVDSDRDNCRGESKFESSEWFNDPLDRIESRSRDFAEFELGNRHRALAARRFGRWPFGTAVPVRRLAFVGTALTSCRRVATTTLGAPARSNGIRLGSGCRMGNE